MSIQDSKVPNLAMKAANWDKLTIEQMDFIPEMLFVANLMGHVDEFLVFKINTCLHMHGI